jgi:hypothetical protein
MKEKKLGNLKMGEGGIPIKMEELIKEIGEGGRCMDLVACFILTAN